MSQDDAAAATPLDEPDFYVAELRRAANEQSWGVQSVGNVAASVPPSMPGATVELKLLEPRSVKIKLTLQGYRVGLLRFITQEH